MNRLGKISLLLSLLCFFTTFAIKLALSGWMPFLSFGLGFGFFFLLFAVFTNLKFFAHAFRSESLRFIGVSVLALLMSLVILGALNFIVYKKNLTFDLTEGDVNSVSELTLDLLKKLKGPVEFYYFHVGSDQSLQFEKVIRLELEKYRQASDQVRFQSHSIFKRPDLAEKFKVGQEESSLFIENQGKIQRVTDIEESAIVNGLLKLSKDPKKIYFWNQNGERELTDTKTFGLSGLKEQIERLHYQLATLTRLDELPEDMALLAIIGSEDKVNPKDFETLKNYFLSGGNILLALDPDSDHNFNDFLKQFGLTLNPLFIFNEQPMVGGSKLLAFTHAGEKPHEIMNQIEDGQGPVLFMATSIELDPLNQENYKITPLLEFLPTSLGRKTVEEESEILGRGRQLASVLVEGQKQPTGRMIVIGDSDFLNNQFFAHPNQFDFILGLFSFLSKDEDLLKLASPKEKPHFLILTQSQMNLYFLFYVLPLSALFFILAFFFKLRRLY